MGDFNKNLNVLARKGTIAIAYSRQFMLTINEAFSIDRVRFSIVKLKTDGKESIDFFLETREMNRLCEEVINGRAEQRIEADTGKEPNAYRFASGDGGNMILRIGKGDVGVRVQISDRFNTQNTWFVPIKFADLYDIAFMYRLMSGLVLTQEGHYYNYLQHEFLAGITERKEEKQQKRSVVDDKHMTAFNVVIYGEPKTMKGFLSFSGTDTATNDKVSVLFRQDGTFNQEAMDSLIERAGEEPVSLYFIGERRGAFVLYHCDIDEEE